MESSLERAINLLISFDKEVYYTVWISLRLSVLSTLFASMISIPLGIFLSFRKSQISRIIQVVFRSLMAIPTVVIGLFVYSILSRQGIFGSLGLLFTQSAIIIGQVILIVPIITSMVIGVLKSVDPVLQETLNSYNIKGSVRYRIILREVKFQMLLSITAGFGRVIGEVGVSMMLGGNIRWHTRTITTSIAMETSKGNFEQGLALGIILLIIALGINILLGGGKNE